MHEMHEKHFVNPQNILKHKKSAKVEKAPRIASTAIHYAQ